MNHETFVFKNVLKNTCVFYLRLILDIFEYSETCKLDNINLFIIILNQKSYMYFPSKYSFLQVLQCAFVSCVDRKS